MPIPLLAAGALSAVPGLLTGLLGKGDRNRRRKRIGNAYGNVGNQFQTMSSMFGNQIAGYNNEMAGGYMNSVEGAGVLGSINRTSDNQRRNFANLGAMSGLSDEAMVAGMGRINESEGSAVSGLAQNANQYRRGLQMMRAQAGNQQMESLQSLFNSRRAVENDVVQGNSAYMANLGQSLGGAVSSGLSGMFDAGMFSDQLFRSKPRKVGSQIG